MQTRYFCELLERAYRTLYGPIGSEMILVPYDPDPSDKEVEVIDVQGLLLMKDVHMAVIAAEAVKQLVTDSHPETMDLMCDFVTLMQGMEIAPYMQWHCAYFPNLPTEEGDRNVTEVLGPGTAPPPDGVQKPYGSADLFHLFESTDDVGLGAARVMWYSGRGMMGKECVAITGAPTALLSVLQEATTRMNEDLDEPMRADVLHRLTVMSQDALGHDSVYYFTLFPKEQ